MIFFLCHISVSVKTGKNSEKIMKCSFTEMFITKPCTPADCNDKLEFRYLVTHRDVDKEILSKERQTYSLPLELRVSGLQWPCT